MMLLLMDNYKLASKITDKTQKKKKNRIPWVRQSGAYCGDFQIRASVLLSYFTASSDYTSPQETH